MDNIPTAAHTLSKQKILTQLETSENGLTADQVQVRLNQYGPNKLPETKKLRAVTLFLAQFMNAMVALMITAAILSLLFDHLFDAILIFVIVIINAIMGFVQEYRAEQSVAALKQLLVSKVLVKRDGHTIEITQDQVTMGDIIQLQEGDKVPADAYILSTHNCFVNESPLTGESVPVEKKTGTLPEKTSIGDRTNMLWMGTALTQGEAEAVVTAIGIQTEFGKIATSLQTVKSEKEHFSQKISILSKQMGGIAILSAVATFLVGYFIRGFGLGEISVYTIATLVSALPEGLPIILVIVLAVGAQRMAKKNAIVRKLSATETLGVVSVIITDKTGTLTQNTMSARKVYLPGQAAIEVKNHDQAQELAFFQQNQPLLIHQNGHLGKLVSIAGVCHQIRISDDNNVNFSTIFGDSTEKALFLLAYKAGFQNIANENKPQVIDNIPFQQHLRMRGCLVASQQGKELFVLGAPESVLDRCPMMLKDNKVVKLSNEIRQDIEQQMSEFSSSGLRVVAIATFPAPQVDDVEPNHLDSKKGTFVGLVGLYDPPRPEVNQALNMAREAGIKIVMATGDHPQTALAIGKEIGLVPNDYPLKHVLTQTDIDTKNDKELSSLLKEVTILARLTPETKMRIAGLYQKLGHIVAMTGDGVNDAPALKKADVGISMGITGTEVAREASKIVLTDDNFASIVGAIKEGRTQFSNLRRTSFFLIMTNVAESATLLIALIIGFPLPLLPVQILWLNVITGGLTDFALSLEPSHEETMKSPPRSPDENILKLSVLPLVGIITLVTTILCLLAFNYFLPQSIDKARTALFVVLSCSQLLNMFSLRSLRKSVLKLGLFTNKAVVFAFIISSLLLFTAIWFKPIQSALQFAPLSLTEMGILLGVSSLLFVTAEITKLVTSKVKIF